MASIWSSAETLARRGYDWAKIQWRDYSPAGRAIAQKRADCERMLDSLARSSPRRFEGTVLVDGMWDNPNYWLRYSLLRTALGLAHGREVGLVGPHRKRRCRGTFDRLGIGTTVSFLDLPVSDDVELRAATLASSTRSAEDIFDWVLPADVSPFIVYDGILKRQRLASVDVQHPMFARHISEALASIARTGRLLDEINPNLVVVSHPLNFIWGSLAWQALARGIPVVLPFGLFGMLRFARFARPVDLFEFYDRPTRKEIDSLGTNKADSLAAVGRRYLAGRLAGRADDLASVFAFQRNTGEIDKRRLCAMNNWDPSVPIVAFYASNWFDWPHQFGMTQFRDFLDWTDATFAAAAGTSINWLFKPHPAEDWFGGVSLVRLLAERDRPANIAIADKRWNNAAVMRAVDAIVTYHGTAGVEFAAQGKPVLVPDRGKYDDCGFARVAANRAEYLSLVATRWWDGMDLAETKRRAEVFAGWWFCAPDWQKDFVLQDDSEQDALYDKIPALLETNHDVVRREIAELSDWWKSGHRYYHTAKMARADEFGTSNLSSS